MNVLFLTLFIFESLSEQNLYSDLLREFVKNGHRVYAITPIEKREGKKSYIVQEENATILRLQIGNAQKTNVIEKGISTLLIESQYKAGIKKYFSNVKFDLVLYSTPPITLLSAIEYVKKRDGAITYLLLKDIFPQNAVDLGMISKAGLKGILYKYFRRKEKSLYAISDRIGCMSQANVDYVIKHNPEIDPNKVEICPNSIEVIDKSVDEETRKKIREKYGIPQDKKVFIYGGNLGKPQGISFMIECLKKCETITDAYFLIVGDGTEAHLVQEYVEAEHPVNVKYINRLPKEDYDNMVGACDVGLIFLDHRFTIPNFPSRLLSYMQAKLPVLAVTDVYSDVGNVIVNGGFGWWCESNDKLVVKKTIKDIVDTDERKLQLMRNKEYDYLKDTFNTTISYKMILTCLYGTQLDR